MVRWRLALLAGALAGGATLVFGLYANNCTLATLLLRMLISAGLFSAAGWLAGWGVDKLLAAPQASNKQALPTVGLAIDITSEPPEPAQLAGDEIAFQPLTAAGLGNVTGNKRQ